MTEVETSFVEPTSKRAHTFDGQDVSGGGGGEKTMSSVERRAPAFGPDGVRVRSYQEEAAVPQEVRSQLESIGMRTRFNVNRGYGSPPPSFAPSASSNATLTSLAFGQGAAHLVTEREILEHVKANKSSFMRHQSAPMFSNELQPFGGAGIRPTLLSTDDEDVEQGMSFGAALDGSEANENVDPLAAAFFEDGEDEVMGGGGGGDMSANGSTSTVGELKRTREMAHFDEEGDPSMANATALDSTQRTISTLPNGIARSRLGRGSSPFGVTRTNATTLPVSAGLANYLASNGIHTHAAEPFDNNEAAWSQHNFSTYTQSDNF